MIDEQWDVFWGQVFWLTAILLAALPLGIEVWTSASFRFEGSWARAFDAHYTDLALYTLVITAVGAADAFAAALMTWHHNSAWPIAVAVILGGSLLLLALQISNLIVAGVGNDVLHLPVHVFPLTVAWAFFAKTTAELERSGRRFVDAA